MTPQPLLIALTSEMSNSEISSFELSQVAGALQRQAVEDLKPAWSHATAVIQACPDPTKLPLGYWPIVVRQDIGDPNVLGVHLDQNGQPYSLIAFGPDWPTTASHEFLEMACDPWGSRLYRAHSPDPKEPDRHKVVQVLLELCDPCEGFSYPLNGIGVSDFILHQYGNGRTGPYDHLNRLTHSLDVADGGYISWLENGVWKQLTNFGGPQVITLGRRSTSETGSLREWVDARTREHRA